LAAHSGENNMISSTFWEKTWWGAHSGENMISSTFWEKNMVGSIFWGKKFDWHLIL
jgi:hypothetical protein